MFSPHHTSHHFVSNTSIPRITTVSTTNTTASNMPQSIVMKVFIDVQKLRDLGLKFHVSENGIGTIFEETTLQLKPGLCVRVTVTTRTDSSALKENLDLRIRPICDTENSDHELQSVLSTWQTALCLASSSDQPLLLVHRQNVLSIQLHHHQVASS